MNKSKRKQKQSLEAKYRASVSCKRKKWYTLNEAWETAELRYIQKGVITLPYKCIKGHYHLTGNANIGDCSHLPQEYRELFSTYNQKYKESFWKKLRRFIGVEN